MKTCKNIKHMFIHEQCFLNQETAWYNNFVFYVSISKAMVLCFICQYQKQTIRCLFARVYVCACVYDSQSSTVLTPVTTLWMPLWRLTNEKEHWNLSIWTWRSQFTCMQSQPTPNHPINTPLFLRFEGCRTTASWVLNLFYFTHSSLRIHSLFTWTLTKTKVRPLFEKLVAEVSGLNELLANGNSDKTKFLKMSAQVGEQMITDKTNNLKSMGRWQMASETNY